MNWKTIRRRLAAVLVAAMALNSLSGAAYAATPSEVVLPQAEEQLPGEPPQGGADDFGAEALGAPEAGAGTLQTDPVAPGAGTDTAQAGEPAVQANAEDDATPSVASMSVIGSIRSLTADEYKGKSAWTARPVDVGAVSLDSYTVAEAQKGDIATNSDGNVYTVVKSITGFAGTLLPVKGFTYFKDSTEGYYLAYRVALNSDLTKEGLLTLKASESNAKELVTASKSDFTASGSDASYIDIIYKVADKGNTATKSFAITVDYDGAGKDVYYPVTYTYEVPANAFATTEVKQDRALTVATPADQAAYEALLKADKLATESAPAWTDTKLSWTKNATVAGYDEVWKASGTLKCATWSQFSSSKPEMQKGYYTALQVEQILPDELGTESNVDADNGVKEVTFKLYYLDSDGKIASTSGKAEKEIKASVSDTDNNKKVATGSIVKHIATNADANGKKFVVIVDVDGEGDAYKPTTYLFDLSGVTYEGAPTPEQPKPEDPTPVVPKVTPSVATVSAATRSDYENAFKSWKGVPDFGKTELEWEVQKRESGDEYDCVASGSVTYVKGFEGFSNKTELQHGWYTAVMITAPKDISKSAASKSDIAVLTENVDGKTITKTLDGTEFNPTMPLLKCLQVDADGEPKATKFTLKLDWDGSAGSEYSPVFYHFDLTGVTFKGYGGDNSKAEKYVKENQYGIEGPTGVAIDNADDKNDASKKTITFTGKFRLTKNATVSSLGGQDGQGYVAAFKINAPENLKASLSDVSSTPSVWIGRGDSIASASKLEKKEWKDVKVGEEDGIGYFYETTLIQGTDLVKLLDKSANNNKGNDVTKYMVIRWVVDDKTYEETYTIKFVGSALFFPDGVVQCPKDMSIVKPKTAMYVGDTQQLNVSITKAKSTDEIRLVYSCEAANSKPGEATIDQYGNIFAKKPGKVVVTVKAVDSVGKTFLDSKNKPVQKTVTITINEIQAPGSAKAISVTDKGAAITWKVDSGASAEAYIFRDGSTKEIALANLWDGSKVDIKAGKSIVTVASSSIIYSNYNALNGFENGVYSQYFNELTGNTTYTALIVNKATSSSVSAKPQVKSFKFATTKEQPAGITFVNASSSVTHYVTDKNVKYEAARLWANRTTPSILEQDTSKTAANAVLSKITYYSEDPSLVTINSRGELSFKKKAGTTVIGAYMDCGTKGFQEATKSIVVNVAAKDITLTKKTTNFTVGQKVPLRDLLNYNYTDTENIMLASDSIALLSELVYKPAELKQGSTPAKPAKIDLAKNFAEGTQTYKVFDIDSNDNSITALIPTPGVKSYTLAGKATFNGSLITKPNKSEAQTANITVTLGALTKPGAVQAAKADISYDRFKVTFAASKYAENYVAELYTADKKSLVYRDVYSSTDYEGIWFEDLDENTTYNVKVKALYGDQESAWTAWKAVKTTKKVAESTYQVTEGDMINNTAVASASEWFDARFISSVGNNDKRAELKMEDGSGLLKMSDIEGVSWNVEAGDVIMLSAKVDALVRGLETDTLIWTIVNEKGKKVSSTAASIKANKSSFDATLTASQEGTVSVMVQSKTTGNVFGVFTVKVNRPGEKVSVSE